ncbi:MAG: BMP family ABC transporter substrate-binding protein [Lachnospiraceae bacterium]|nr:BMP family ABC transporter substrate-binding protein [Lachnospiraceae bacterium]
MTETYLKAWKLGQKAYKSAVADGTYPYLPVLDEILAHTAIDGEMPLGICEIPLDQVVGTCTLGRTQSFASNFMPLLEAGTEFAYKWGNLYKSQIEEGIRDPIRVYEYLNKYYVLEGNKRASVLKYLKSPVIQADVIRKIPRRSEEPEIRLYYEYMDFYELTKINSLLFSKPGRYAQFLSLVGKDAQTVWTCEERLSFDAFFADFKKAFQNQPDSLPTHITVGDALLFYLNLYPYQRAKSTPCAEIKEQLLGIWQEIALSGTENPVELSMNPIQEKPHPVEAVLNRLILPKIRRAAFVYDKTPEASDWIYGHELGRLHLNEVFGDALQTQVFYTETAAADTVDEDSADTAAADSADAYATDTDSADALFEQLCREGYDIIFAVTPTLMRACLKAAVAHPEVFILNCSLNSAINTVRTYYTRMYEAKFLTGMIAGSLTANNKVGYIADYPLYGAAASINAFALGAKMVNPNAKVYLTWSTLKNADADAFFWENEVSYISAQDMITPQMENRKFGLYQATFDGKRNLAMSIYNWGEFYEQLIRSIQKGSWWAGDPLDNRAINYWWGLSANVIDVICSQHLPSGTVKLIELMKQNISSGLFHPFTGPLIQQDGHVHYTEGQIMKPEDIMRMDWLVDNVVGHIPALDELRKEAQPTVKLRGLYAVTVKEGGNLLL